MAETGMEASVSDAGVAAICARAAVMGAHLNVKINASNLGDKAAAAEYLRRAGAIEAKTLALEPEILKIVGGKL
jgi:glutamate formiminotransferase/formiminotetrahydrofolate cyclodeaminase